ncbi:MAG: penicillin-binding transpeptidase domain-containing protein [Candidatus Omnitrophota bacterium]
MAADQHNKIDRIEPIRGIIFDRYRDSVAVNLDVPSVCCNPRVVKDKNQLSNVLKEKLNVEKNVILEKLHKDKAFIWIKRKVTPEEAEKIKALKIAGVEIVAESERHYPNDSLAAHVIGFVGLDNQGLEGLELLFNKELTGKPGWRHVIRDAWQRPVIFNEEQSIPPRNGYYLVLTIDSVIQYIVEQELECMAKAHNVSSASCVVMDPSSGEILAMANYPAYNLNLFSKTPQKVMKNTAVTDVYEPGSVFKIVAASAILNEGKASLDTRFYCENGSYNVAGRVLHDYHRYGDLSFRDVIARSSNIGVVKASQRIDKKKLCEYIFRFGFGEKTGIDLPGESSGIVRRAEEWSKSDISTIPIGQGIAVTPLQLVCAVSVIANGGYLMRPYIVDCVISEEEDVYRQNKRELRRKVLEVKTCEDMKDALQCVMTLGTGKKAYSKLYEACGKTGTAQMVNPAGGYYSNKYDASFIGFAPKEKPVISVAIVARNPHPVYFGGSVAGPVFKKIVERTLQYLELNSAQLTGSSSSSETVS